MAVNPGPVTNEAIDLMLDVLAAQGYLRIPEQTGEWNSSADRALREWQKDNDLPVTGRIDKATSTRVGEMLAALAPAAASEPSGGGSGGSTGAPEGPGGFPSGGGTAEATPTGAPNPDGLFTIPGGAEIWLVDNTNWYAVYRVPGSRTPLAWKIDSQDDLAAIFGPGKTPTPTRRLNGLEAYAEGPLVFGSSRLLANTSEHPFDAFVANFSTEARIRPWMRDPEVLALTGRALLEGREITEAELAGTRWWQNHTPGEREWMLQSNRDPAGAQQQVTDRRNAVHLAFIQAGVANVPDKLVNLIADRITGGTWTEQYAQTQVQAIADPGGPYRLDPVTAIWVADLQLSGTTLNTLSDNTMRVDDLILRWLGPVGASGIGKKQREEWAGRLRNDPQAEEEITGELRRRRLVLFPEYQDERLSYEDIAGTWRGQFMQIWGTTPDETDPFFTEILRLGGTQPGNDGQSGGLTAVQRRLRSEGLRRNNPQVSQSLLGDIGASDLGAGLRRAS